jgi:hypothetical protein
MERFQDVYLVAETLVGNEPAVPTPDDCASAGSVATRAQTGPGYPVVLNETGIRFRETIENLTGGQRPTFDESFLVGAISRSRSLGKLAIRTSLRGRALRR